MKIKGYISEDFVNYKKPSMTIMFPYCTMKCGKEICQNNPLLKEPNIIADAADMVSRFVNNPITEAVVMQGLEPFDSWEDVKEFITELRKIDDSDVVIYTGYTEEELSDKLLIIKQFENIIIKFGRYVPNQEGHMDEILGVKLASPNQYARRF